MIDEVNDAKFSPDTCDCIIYFEAGFCMNNTKITGARKCKLHRGVPDSLILTQVLSHNNSFNLKHGNIQMPSDFEGLDEKTARTLATIANRTDVILTLDRLKEIETDKKNEKDRIRRLP